jgi:predicted alpha/beta-fold hydrolase
MPVIPSSFKTSFPFTNKHFSTIYRTLFTNPKVTYQRKRIATLDGDFLDLDISSVGSKNMALLVHGLEGSSNSKYVLSTTNYLNKHAYDVIVLNLRGCSGELNKKFRAYHSGETNDLDFVINYITSKYTYTSISLVGFSMGGNIVLKYTGEQEHRMIPAIKSVIAISPPCDLKGSSIELAKKSNFIYMKRFLKTLVTKALQKSEKYPKENLKKETLLKAKTFYHFDTLFTAPSFGFDSAEDYWKKASSNTYLSKIKTPTYLLTAYNDPFLSESCIPVMAAHKNKYLNLESPKHGGHIGFIRSFSSSKNNWCEEKITKFMQENNSNSL